jgi:hypothetical protein
MCYLTLSVFIKIFSWYFNKLLFPQSNGNSYRSNTDHILLLFVKHSVSVEIRHNLPPKK